MQISDARGVPFLREQSFLVTPVLDTSAYASGDVLFVPTEIKNFFTDAGEARVLQSMKILDEDAQGAAFDLVLFTSTQAIGTLNGAATITDAMARTIAATQKFAASDWVDWSAWRMIELAGIGKVLESETTSLWVAGIARGTPTHTAAGLKIRIGVL